MCEIPAKLQQTNLNNCNLILERREFNHNGQRNVIPHNLIPLYVYLSLNQQEENINWISNFDFSLVTNMLTLDF